MQVCEQLSGKLNARPRQLSVSCHNMDITSCFCVLAVASLFITLWRLKGRHGAPHWTGSVSGNTGVIVGVAGVIGGVVGVALCEHVPPAVSSLILLTCGCILIQVTDRKSELLLGERRAVLVTGCDSGFGHDLAKRLSHMGLTVFAGVLDLNGVGARQLRDAGCENLQVLQLDVTDSVQIETARSHISAQVSDTGLWGLVNNAGVLHCPVDAELHPIATYRRLMDVNFLAAVKVCQVFLPLLRRSRGRVVNISSMAGEVPLPLFAAYGASKAALALFSQVMRMELSAWGVRVALIQPAGFRTNIFGSGDDITRYRDELLTAVSSNAREDYGEAYISSLPQSLPRMSQQTAEDLSPVVDAMCHALLAVHPRPLYTPGNLGWLLPFLQRCCPIAVFDAIVTTFLRKTTCKPAGLGRS